MCAAVAGPLSFEKLSFHLSVFPLTGDESAPPAAGVFTACFGTSCLAVSIADHPVARVLPSDAAVTTSAHPTASNRTSFLTMDLLTKGACEGHSFERPGRFAGS